MEITELSEQLNGLIIGVERCIEGLPPTHLVRINLERFAERLKREDSYLDGYIAAMADEKGL